MKRIFWIGFFILVLVLIWQWRPLSRTGEVPVSPEPTQSESISISVTPGAAVPADIVLFDSISLDTVRYTMFGREIPRGTTVTLVPNFSRRVGGQLLAQEQQCHTAINGGFYTKEGNPLGLFISEGSSSGKQIESNLVTGFFWQNKEGKRYLSRTAPETDDVDFVMQTGPYMHVRDQRLQLVSDEPARRSLLAVDEQDRLYMLSVTEKSNTFSGPNLADIPVLLNQPEVQEKIPFRTVINLDGGTASFFSYAGDNQSFVLSELAPVGSLICVK